MPALPEPVGGVRFRHRRGESDYPGVVQVYNAARLADGVSGIETLEDFTNQYRHLTNCDLDRDLVVLERADGTVVGYARATWWVEEATNDRLLLAILFLHPEVRGRGVAEVMMTWLEARLAEMAVEHPHSGKDFFIAFLDEGETEREAVLTALGYERTETYAEMTRSLADPIPELALPEGVAIRPTTWADARAVWEADDRAFQDHIGYRKPTEDDYEAWRAEQTNDPSLWKVAFSGDVIAGQVLNYVNQAENSTLGRKWGYTESISVQREWRQRGIAKALISESMRMFRDMGMEYAALGVHTTNPNGAFPLYEGLGYRVTKLGWQLRKPLAG
ncbi:MAG: GNAT family N-acetyltransferase [Acidimicrobiia bacterium]|nr:GNAT family N-acetyltransferase [Acidimicrobiia bacterium]